MSCAYVPIQKLSSSPSICIHCIMASHWYVSSYIFFMRLRFRFSEELPGFQSLQKPAIWNFPQCRPYQFIQDFRRIVLLQKHFPETGVGWSEKSTFLTLNAPFELDLRYFRLDTMWFVRRANKIGEKNLIPIRASCATLSGEEKQMSRGKTQRPRRCLTQRRPQYVIPGGLITYNWCQQLALTTEIQLKLIDLQFDVP